MRVNDPNLTSTSADLARGAGLERTQQAEEVRQRQTGGTKSSNGQASDSVALSGLGSQLRALNVDSPERVARLDKLSADVSTGRYQVDPQQLSQSLIEDAMKPRL